MQHFHKKNIANVVCNCKKKTLLDLAQSFDEVLAYIGVKYYNLTNSGNMCFPQLIWGYKQTFTV